MCVIVGSRNVPPFVISSSSIETVCSAKSVSEQCTGRQTHIYCKWWGLSPLSSQFLSKGKSDATIAGWGVGVGDRSRVGLCHLTPTLLGPHLVAVLVGGQKRWRHVADVAQPFTVERIFRAYSFHWVKAEHQVEEVKCWSRYAAMCGGHEMISKSGNKKDVTITYFENFSRKVRG